MKKKTKIIAIGLSCVIGIGAIFGGSILINNVVNKVKGTDAAKILLARNRMDAKDTSFKWTEIIESATENSVNVSALNAPLTYGEPEMKDYGQLVADSAAGKVYKDGTIVSETDAILPGVVYKMKFKISTADGVVDGYVYCETPISAD